MRHHIKKQMVIADAIHVYLLDIKENYNAIDQGIIPLMQQADIRKYKIKQDRDKRLLARSFLFGLLKQEYGITDFEFGYTSYKQPFIKIAREINFSFSYADDFVIIAVSKEKKTGIDIEYINRKFDIIEIAAEIMCEEELEYFNSFENRSADQCTYFFQLFSAKEAIIKAFGTGLYYDVKKINTLKEQFFTHEKAQFRHQHLIPGLADYSLSICFEQ